MLDEASAIGTFAVQLGLDLAVQVTLALLVAYAWEYERRLIWWDVDAHPIFTDGFLLFTGLCVGALGVLAWPHSFIERNQFLEITALVTPAAAGFAMHRAGRLIHARGYEPPALLAMHAATIFVVGVALIRTFMFANVSV
jgi:hypothetical protein